LTSEKILQGGLIFSPGPAYMHEDEMTKKITLTNGGTAIVDDQDYEYLSGFKWYSSLGYAIREERDKNHNRISIAMHRKILGLMHGDKRQVDHKDMNTLNNTRANLRIATPSENRQNRKKTRANTTGYKGVMVTRSNRPLRYLAEIRVYGKHIYLGTFDTPEDAARAYDEAAKLYFGEFARLNFQESSPTEENQSV
jgi:hypothetical protein